MVVFSLRILDIQVCDADNCQTMPDNPMIKSLEFIKVRVISVSVVALIYSGVLLCFATVDRS